MSSFLFRCPVTGLQVQGWLDDATKEKRRSFITVACTACSGSHFVNPVTGEVLGEEKDKDKDKD